MTPRILALDPSLTATGLAWNDQLDRADVVSPPRAMKGDERLSWLAARLSPEIVTAQVLVVEGYAYGAKYSSHQAGEWGGIIRLLAYRAKTPVAVVPPAKLKMYAAGKGNANKVAVLLAAVRRLGYTGGDHNVGDALWLCHMGMSVYGDRNAVVVPQTHRKALDGVEWPEPRQRDHATALRAHRIPRRAQFPSAVYECDGCPDLFAPPDLTWISDVGSGGWLCPQCFESQRLDFDEATLWTFDEVLAAYG